MSKNPEVEKILSSIFLFCGKATPSSLPILNSLKEIPQLILFLQDSQQKIEQKMDLISTLICLFKINENIIPPFTRKFLHKSKEYHFFEPLIDLYLIPTLKKEHESLLDELFKIILTHVTITKNALEYVYQKLSSYYTNTKQEILNESILLRYLKILKLFYSDVSSEAKTEKEIKNYMYFNGKNSALKFSLNKSTININTDFPTLENGLSFVFWCYIKKELMTQYYEKDEKNKFKFVEIKISGHVISLVLNDVNNIKVIIDDNQSTIINVKDAIKFNDWNNLCFIISPKSAFKLEISIYINGKNNSSFLPITKEFKASEKISNINLFQNFLGLSTSILFFSFELNTKQIQFFNSLKHGFFKNKLLYEFFMKNDKNYLSNGVNKYKYANQVKVDKPLNLFDFSLKKQNIKHLICFLCPFTYNKEKNVIDDIFGNFIGEFSENDGINNYKKNAKSIKSLGGTNNLLPIVELMYSSISKSKKIKYNYIDKSILSEKTFLEYFKVLNTILLERPRNVIDANNRKFFSSLGLFLEKFPPNIFTNEILKIFLDLGKESYQMTENKSKDNFVNMILLNEKIFSKFKKETQLELWDNIQKFFESDYSQMVDSLNMSKLYMLLRFYDANRYNEYCCANHANLFKPQDTKEKYNPKVMYPEVNSKVKNIFEIIKLHIDKLTDGEETAKLYKMLSLDISPCMQKKIIQTYIIHFKNDKIEIDRKKKTLDSLLKNNFLEISEYVLCISLLDVRIEMLKLFKVITDNKDLSEIYTKYISNMRGEDGLKNLNNFIGDNILPDRLTVEIKQGEKEKLMNYFNNEFFNKDLDKIWELLSQWIIIKTGHKPKSVNVKANSNITISETIIEYCLLFISRAPEKYVDLFLAIVYTFFKDETIVNRNLLYTNKYIYPWVIETIFFFYNVENEPDIKDKKILKSIKNQTILFFSEYFSHRRPQDEFMNRTNYILKYSYSLKKLIKDEPKKIEETFRITRLLLEKLLECVPTKINEIINLYYEFIILYKNKEKLPEIKKNITDELKNLVIKLKNLNIATSTPDSQNVFNSGLMPKYVYDGLNCNKLESGKKGTLKEIWKDFGLYDSIIDSYKSNLWGIENLCKKVKVEYTGDPLRLCKNLLKEYGDNKAYRNILKDDIIKYFNIQLVEKDNTTKIVEDNMVNIFNINLILLCIAIDITQDEDERSFIIGLYQQFMIYCVMVSININQQDKYHDYIQQKVYDALGFGALFLNRRNKTRYDELCNELLIPIFEEVTGGPSKKKTKTLFGGKKNLFKDTAIVKLFQYTDKDAEVTRASDANKKNPAQKKEDQKKNKSVANIPVENYEIVFKGEVLKILKNIFDSDLLNEKNEKKEDAKIENFYKNVYKTNGIYDKIINEEKAKVYRRITKLIPFFESQIKEYSNSSFLQEKKRRNDYKWTKKRLFAWRGFWSDRDLFFNHPEHLKLKLKNHLSREMTMPLLCPVIDVDYYMPDFGKFDSKKLFNEGDYNYKIILDIDDILRDELEETIEKSKNNSENKTKDKTAELNFVKNNYNFNYLESLYKHSDEKIWEKYVSYYDQEFNFNKIILENKVTFDMFQGSRTISKTDEERRIENQYNCCIVKQTHHIKGYISTEKTRIKFFFDPESRKYDTNESLENDPTYDRDMDCCFGSTFKTNKRDKDKINFIIEYENIKYMFLRYYFYIQSGIEIYTKNNKVYFLNFKTKQDLSTFTNDVLSHSNDKFAFREIKTDDYKGKKLLGYELVIPSIKAKEYFISSKMQEWQSHNLSNLEYLMWLNIYAGRSFNDLTQYPVFPWIITNYSGNEIDNKKDLRNLSLPMGMLGLSEKGELRKETFAETYDMVKNDLKEMFPDFNYSEFLKKQDDYYENYRNKKKKKKDAKSDEMKLDVNHLPYFYGSHYSNPTYISHYLSRSFPYAFVAIEIQGEKFDDPDRLFLSMNKTFISASSLKDDVRELIPEFFITPEILINKNNLNLDQGKTGSDNKKSVVNDVELPPWAKKNACTFVAEMRRILEKGDLKLNKWIDLIFGSYQRGEKAEEHKNIFKAQSYERMVKIDDITDPDSRNALMRLVEIGVTPFQIFATDTKPQLDKKQFLEKSPKYLNAKGSFIYENKPLTCKIMKSNNFNNIKKKIYENEKCTKNKEYALDKNDYGNIRIIKINQIEHNNIKIYTNTNQWYNIKYSPNSKDLSPEESVPIDIDNNSSKLANSYKMNGADFPLIIYDNWKFLLKGGFWDGRIEFNTLITEQKEESLSNTIFTNSGSCITIMELSKKENYLLCGTNEGLLLSYRINKTKIELKNSLFIHSEPIVSISINDTLNIFATSSKDGYIMIYTLPSFDLVRSIYIPSLFQDESEFLYADNVFISNSPLPSITVYISKKKLFKTFTINGHFMQDLKEEEGVNCIKSPLVFTSFDYQDYLIYGTDNGLVRVRKFPEMDLVNSANPFNNGKSVECICLSLDQKYCFAWSSSNEIAVMSNCFTK